MNEQPNNISQTIVAWQEYLQTVDDWQVLIKNIKPKISGCGHVYELKNPTAVGQINESFAIADM